MMSTHDKNGFWWLAVTASNTTPTPVYDLFMASLAEPTDPPLGDILWLIERPVTVIRNGVTCVGPLLLLKRLTQSEWDTMPSAYERKAIGAVLTKENGVWSSFTPNGELQFEFAAEF